MFKVNNKETRTTSLTSFWFLYCWHWTYLTPCSSASIVNFEHVNADWGVTNFPTPNHTYGSGSGWWNAINAFNPHFKASLFPSGVLQQRKLNFRKLFKTHTKIKDVPLRSTLQVQITLWVLCQISSIIVQWSHFSTRSTPTLWKVPKYSKMIPKNFMFLLNFLPYTKYGNMLEKNP